MLEAVQQRQHDRAVERRGIDAAERLLERVRLHGDDEERDGPVEAGDHLRARDGRLTGVDARQPDAPIASTVPRADAQGAGPRDEHAADPAEAGDRDGHGRHTRPGSTTRFTYWVSEDVQRLDPAFQPCRTT